MYMLVLTCTYMHEILCPVVKHSSIGVSQDRHRQCPPKTDTGSVPPRQTQAVSPQDRHRQCPPKTDTGIVPPRQTQAVSSQDRHRQCPPKTDTGSVPPRQTQALSPKTDTGSVLPRQTRAVSSQDRHRQCPPPTHTHVYTHSSYWQDNNSYFGEPNKKRCKSSKRVQGSFPQGEGVTTGYNYLPITYTSTTSKHQQKKHTPCTSQ